MTRPRTPGNPLAQDFTLIPLLRFAFPTIATMLFMGLYTMTDNDLHIQTCKHKCALSRQHRLPCH